MLFEKCRVFSSPRKDDHISKCPNVSHWSQVQEGVGGEGLGREIEEEQIFCPAITSIAQFTVIDFDHWILPPV